MIDDRDLLERALRRFEPDPGLAERVMRRRERKRRNQRLMAAAVGGAIGLAVVLAAALPAIRGTSPADEPSPTPVPERVGFIGVPPEGAEPSLPVSGELVLNLDTTVGYGDTYKTRLYVYADGRMIWERHAAPTGVPEGAAPNRTGYLEQVLTPEGVETLRSEILATGLFADDLHLKGEFEGDEHIYGVSIRVRGADGMVSLEWARGFGDERRPTPAELDTIRSLVERLEDPGAWLPETAWEDRQIRAFVASSYWVNFSLVTKPGGECCLRPDPSQLPPPASEILTGRPSQQCVTTDEARMIVESFEAAGIEPEKTDDAWGGAQYETGATGANGIPQLMLLAPNLPDTSCG